RQARAQGNLKLRQPLRLLVVEGADAAAAYVDEIGEELRVKEVRFGPVEAVQVRVKPNLPLLGPKLGAELADVRRALDEGRFTERDGLIVVGRHELGPAEVLIERSAVEGWALAENGGVTVAISTQLDADLELEARVLELIHRVNSMRRDAGLELSDRIALTVPRADEDLLAQADWIKAEVLAESLESGAELAVAKV
ncbi:MAG: DUF5915 domain-containing protein, partial [Gaiellaceae bacterium]